MKRIKKLVVCGMAVACTAALLALMTGCSSSEPYTPPEKTPTLASPVIGKDGTLRVGVNTDSAPLAGQPQNSTKIVGIDVDIAAALADYFGLKLEIVDVGTDPATALTDGRVDIVMGVDKLDADTSFWKSDAYLPSAVALFSTKGNTTVPTNASKPSVAAQISSKSAWAVTNEFDQGTITTTDKLKDAFAELASGNVQYVAADAVIGSYAAYSDGVDVQIVALMQQLGGYSIGALESNTDLKTAIADAIATLTSNGVISVIETKWLGTTLDLSATPLTEGAMANKTATTPEQEPTPEEGDTPTPAEGEGDGTEPPAEDEGQVGEPGENAVQL